MGSRKHETVDSLLENENGKMKGSVGSLALAGEGVLESECV